MNKGPRVLLVEDETALVMTIRDRLEAEGYMVDSASDGPSGFEKASSGLWDLVLLDVMLPGKNGFDICRDLRGAGKGFPIMMLTARGQVIDRVLGLKLGADDYLCKPFDMTELMARIEALLRRAKSMDNDEEGKSASLCCTHRGREDYGDFIVDFASGYVQREGEKYDLSAQEYKLLAYLSAHPDQIIGRDELLNAAWSYDSETSTRTVDVHVAWLRKKIGDAGPIPKHILTVRGLGYKFIGLVRSL